MNPAKKCSYDGCAVAPAHEVTLLLERYRAGDAAAGEALVPLVYGELREMAQKALARREHERTLQSTALIHEAWIRIERVAETNFSSRDHFFAVAARAMRSVLVDRARRRIAAKRGGDNRRIELDECVDSFEDRSKDLLALDVALRELHDMDPELAQIVELRFFGGMKHPAIAGVMGLSLRRVERGWATARAWLFAQLEDSTERA